MFQSYIDHFRKQLLFNLKRHLMDNVLMMSSYTHFRVFSLYFQFRNREFCLISMVEEWVLPHVGGLRSTAATCGGWGDILSC